MESVKDIDINFEEFQEFIDKRHTYFSDKYNVISEYRREKQINDDYRGRQLLELIQNADDAGSKFVGIKINTTTKTLEVTNEGEPFSIGGFRSLMITNLSTKRKKKYIGNKGLGFRSILNWSEKVIIDSGKCIVTFSNKQAEAKFLELYPNEEERLNILKEFDYNENVIPFPIFGIPSVQRNETKSELTKVQIEYDPSVESDILNQIKTLRKEVLLFLNHIERIEIDTDGSHISHNSSREKDKITVDSNTWTIYSNRVDGVDPIMPEKYRNTETNEIESYSLKIAIQEGLKDNINKLFTYFPTKISLHFPLVIHGTFELDSSRNRITETPKNKFLVQELIKLIFTISDSFFGTTATWDKFRLLNYKGNKDAVLEDFGFYKAIDSKLKSLPVFPCIDNQYRSYTEIKYYSNNFVETVIELGQQSHFPELLQKIPDDVLGYLREQFPNYGSEKRYTEKIFVSKIEEVSKLIHNTVSHEQYAKWVSVLSNYFVSKSSAISILYNENNQLIGKENTIFTPPSKNALVEVPGHIGMDYMNTELFNALVNSFRISDDNEKARRIKDKLENFVNIQSFEPAPVVTKIVTNTYQQIVGESDNERKVFLCKEMLKSLYNYYSRSSRAKDTQIRTGNVPVLNLENEIIIAKNSFLSKEYPIGNLRTEILGEIYSSKSQVASASTLGLDDINSAEEFLVDFLGVNKFVQLEQIVEKINPSSSYCNFVFKYKGKPDRYRNCRVTYTQISNLALIKENLATGKLTREDIITWICVDKEIRDKLHSSSESDFRYDQTNQVNNNFYYKIADAPSFIRFQINDLGLFEDYLLNDGDSVVLNEFHFNYRSEKFTGRGIDSSVIKEVLIQLGAKTEFSDLSIVRVEQILKELPEKDALGKQARKIYQLAIDRFKEKGEKLKDYSNLYLHSTKDKQKGYALYSEVYYANNIGLPRRILNEKSLLNYPKRSGEQNISEFFKVKTFENITYTAADYIENEIATLALNRHLKQIRPFILVHRLQKLKSEADIREAVNIIKSLNFILCDELSYDFNGTINSAETYDFVPSKNDKFTFLIKYSFQSSINTLKLDSNLSDVISEIYSIAFDLSNLRSEIRSIFRNDIEDTTHQIIDEFGEENFQNAKSKLDLTSNEINFWKTIFELKHLEQNFPSFNEEIDFRKLISSILGVDIHSITNIDYDLLTARHNVKTLYELFIKLGISVNTFNEKNETDISFEAIHFRSLQEQFEKFKEEFICKLWEKLRDEQESSRVKFISIISAVDSQVVNDIVAEIRYNLNCNYSDLIVERVEKLFQIKLTGAVLASDYLNTFNQNIANLDVTSQTADLLTIENRSLLYFPLSEDKHIELTNILASFNNKSSVGGVTSTGNETGSIEPPKQITELPASHNPPAKKTSRRNGKRSSGVPRGAHANSDDDAKKELGKKAEEEVLRALVARVGEQNVLWLSGFSNHPDKSDAWGFDIKFRENHSSEWNYVEVKSFYLDAFYLTQNELDFAIENSDRYFIYLVSESDIKSISIDKLIDENKELLFENDYFQIEVKDYKFTSN